MQQKKHDIVAVTNFRYFFKFRFLYITTTATITDIPKTWIHLIFTKCEYKSAIAFLRFQGQKHKSPARASNRAIKYFFSLSLFGGMLAPKKRRLELASLLLISASKYQHRLLLCSPRQIVLSSPLLFYCRPNRLTDTLGRSHKFDPDRKPILF